MTTKFSSRRPVAVLVDQGLQREASEPDMVTISVVPDLSKVLDARSTRLHGDVIDALVDLVVELLDEDIERDESKSG